VSVADVDHDWTHLYPPFRQRLAATFGACSANGLEMQMVEGYRSPARQLWLYAQGRTRPGNKVTALRVPKWHGAGCAADSYPVHGGRVVFAFTAQELSIYRAAMASHGLRPTKFAGDLGHAELDTPDLEKAMAWCDGGFKPMTDPTPIHTDPPPPAADRIAFDGRLVDIPMLTKDGEHYLHLRELCANRGWEVSWDAPTRVVNVKTG
jgi:hypothetical protein